MEAAEHAEQKSPPNRVRLTDRYLKAVKPGGPRRDAWDTVVTGLSARISPRGKITWSLLTRLYGHRHATRISLGTYPVMTLEAAREAATEALRIAAKRLDPRQEEKRLRALEAAQRQNTLARAVADYEALKMVGQNPDEPLRRHGKEVIARLRKEFLADFTVVRKDTAGKVIETRRRPGIAELALADIRWEHVQQRLDDAVWRGSPFQGYHLLSDIRALLNWCVTREGYGVEKNVCEGKDAKDVIGDKAERDRKLSDYEIGLYWRATAELGPLFGDLCRLLLLTAARREEVGGMTWDEVDLTKREWVVAAERYKNRSEHLIPLTDRAIEILSKLPRTSRFVFPTARGDAALSGYSKLKTKLDDKMLELAKLDAEKAGKDPRKVSIKAFVLHDVRRTCRSKFSELEVPFIVAEECLGHRAQGLRRTYDRHDYKREKRDALEKLANHVDSLSGGPPLQRENNVVAYRK